jgi:hypothetical protein
MDHRGLERRGGGMPAAGDGPIALGLASAPIGAAGWMLHGAREAARAQAEQAAGNVVLGLERAIARRNHLSLHTAAAGLDRPELAWLSPEIRRVIIFDGAAAPADFGAILVTDPRGDRL